MLSRIVSNRVSSRLTAPVVLTFAFGLMGCGSSKNHGITPEPTTTGLTTDPPASSTSPTPPASNTGPAGTSGGTGTTAPPPSTPPGPSGATGGDTSGPADSTDPAAPDSTDGARSSGETSEPSGPMGSSEPDTSAPTSTECTRDLLDGVMDAYLDALNAHDPSSLPLAENHKFTENAEVVEIGTTDFWKTAGAAKHTQRALDTTACSVAAQAVIPEGATDLPVGIRLKVEAGKLTEIETIVVRQGDYALESSNPNAIIGIAEEVGWHDEVPEAERATREELSAWIEKYFRAFPAGVCTVSSACKRLENGGGNYDCGVGGSCSNDNPTTGGSFEPRLILVDEVRGIAVGFTIFDFTIEGHLDMHMVKMSGGQVRAVHAILRNTQGKSGWE